MPPPSLNCSLAAAAPPPFCGFLSVTRVLSLRCGDGEVRTRGFVHRVRQSSGRAQRITSPRVQTFPVPCSRSNKNSCASKRTIPNPGVAHCIGRSSYPDSICRVRPTVPPQSFNKPDTTPGDHSRKRGYSYHRDIEIGRGWEARMKQSSASPVEWSGSGVLPRVSALRPRVSL